MAPSWALDYHGLLLALTVAQDGTATGQAGDHVSCDYALGAVIAIGARVADCQMDYFPSKDPESNNGTLRLVDHDSGSWVRLYYNHDNGGPYPLP